MVFGLEHDSDTLCNLYLSNLEFKQKEGAMICENVFCQKETFVIKIDREHRKLCPRCYWRTKGEFHYEETFLDNRIDGCHSFALTPMMAVSADKVMARMET
jgi:hypothetical protein